MKKTKIICSIGPSSSNPDVMEKMVRAGMNVARFNFSHITEEELQYNLNSVHEVTKRTGLHIGILYDTKGPEFRNGVFENGSIELVEGKVIRIVKDDVIGNEERFTVNHPEAIDSISIDDNILLEDGLFRLVVISKEEDGVTCRVVSGGTLGDKKTMNVPGVKLEFPFIGKQDKDDLIYAARHEADFLALSFVNTKEDVLEARKILDAEGGKNIQIISKIESQSGIDNLDAILEVSDGVMVARGDLGVEVEMELLPIYQKSMIQKCRELGKTCIVATEMLESMKKSARPTRAEISDVANAVLDGTDAVMLSGETTVGKHPTLVVEYMANICESTEKYYDYNYSFDADRKIDITETIAKSVVDSAELLDVKVIVAATMSGYSAKKISNLKPDSFILATTPTAEVARSLALNWGVYTALTPIYNSTDEVIADGIKQAKKFMDLKEKDYVVITGGFPNNSKVKATNLLKIEQI
jgi:pyruvate kinase